MAADLPINPLCTLNKFTGFRSFASESKMTNSSGVSVLSQNELGKAAELLLRDELVAFPTDTFYALGAVLTEAAISALFEGKGRVRGNPVPVLIATADQVQLVATDFPDVAKKLADKFWPGPLTLVLPARDDVPSSVTAGMGTVGVRVPDHRVARDLIAAVGGPVTGTSANLSCSPPCKVVDDVLSQLGDQIKAVIDAPCGEHSAPSTVVGFSDTDDSDIHIIRQGAISEAALRQVLNR
jgi:L-threonylcarbamoyladenylate synthase